MKRIFENRWIREIAFLLFFFILFTLNDWVLILNVRGFIMGFIYFLTLYCHAQVNRFALLPVLTVRHKPVAYILSSLLLLLVFAFILDEFTQHVIYKNCFLYKSYAQRTFQYQLSILLASFICIVGSIQFMEYYRFQRLQEHRELLSNKSQVESLKKQLNPHFLFNTLNTIYGINLKFPERTSDLILKVSQLMRYQLESIDKELVPLTDEIEFLSSYIELEKERVGYRCRIEFVADYNENASCKIAPMLLITFIENAFKHGTCSIEECFVDISVLVNNNVLQLLVRNSIPGNKTAVHSTRIGLMNTQARLKLIYPDRHELKIEQDEKQYSVDLRLTL